MSLQKKIRRRVSYLPTFFSISLVLFLLGLFALFLLNANKLKNEVRENVEVRIFLKDDIHKNDVEKLQQKLRKKSQVRDAVYVSKEDGLKQMQENMGVNAEEIMGYNPLPNSINLRMASDFMHTDSLQRMKTELEMNPIVREVYYEEIMVQDINRNMRVIGVIVLSLAFLMLAVSIALIHNTMRLTLYSKRFLIKSMQLVGATRNFIRKPFIIKGFIIGLLSSIFACVLLMLSMYIFSSNYPEISLLQDGLQLFAVFAGIILLGIIISALSSWFAINKYLKMKLDDLF